MTGQPFIDQPAVRLAVRALIAGGIAAGVAIQNAATLDHAAVMAAGSAAVMAFLEVFTPVNRTVGAFKQPNGPSGQPATVDLAALNQALIALRETNQLLSQLGKE